jgi:Ca-activated chloride channel homolog
VDAGEIGSGHRVTALYELVFEEEDMPMVDGAPAAEDGAAYSESPEVDPADLVLVKVRYKAPDAKESDAASEVSGSLTPDEVHSGFEGAASSMQWAAAVAAYAEILKNSPYADKDALEAIRLVIEAQAGLDADRTEFLSLFNAANSLRD